MNELYIFFDTVSLLYLIITLSLVPGVVKDNLEIARNTDSSLLPFVLTLCFMVLSTAYPAMLVFVDLIGRL